MSSENERNTHGAGAYYVDAQDLQVGDRLVESGYDTVRRVRRRKFGRVEVETVSGVVLGFEVEERVRVNGDPS
jgi:hypothetical protein